MGRKRHKPEEIIAKLRQVDVLTAQEMPVVEAICRSASPRSPTTGGPFVLLKAMRTTELQILSRI
jgi:hypothetical protein